MFGEKLISLRKQQGLSQEDIAKKLFVSRQAVSKWEKNQSLPDIEKLKDLCRIFNVSMDFLLDNSEKETVLFKKAESVSNNITGGKNSKAKPLIMICIGAAILFVLIVLSSFIPADVRVSKEIKADDIIAVSPTENGEYVADGETARMIQYETAPGNMFAFINTYYLHGVVLAALILIAWGICDVIKKRKFIREENLNV